MEILAVENGVDLRLLATVEEMIDEYFIARQVLEQTQYAFLQFFVVDNNTHALTAQYIRWTNQHRVANLVGHFDGFIRIVRGTVAWIRDTQFFQHIAETAAVFGDIHVIERSTDDADTFFIQALGQFERRLPAELHDDAIGFFVFDDLPEVFPENGFEVEFIGNVEIGGNGFGVAVDHDGFVAGFLDRLQTMHAAIIEFDALADAVGSASQYDDLFLIGNNAFVARKFIFVNRFAFKGRVEVRCLGLELSAAGIHHLIHTGQSHRFSFFIDGFLVFLLYDVGDLLIAEAKQFGFPQQGVGQGVQFVLGQLLFAIAYFLDLVDEPAVDLGAFADAFNTGACHQGILDAEDAVPFRRFDVFQQSFGMHEALAVVTQTNHFVLQALAGLLYRFGETSSDTHYLTHALHGKTECVFRSLEFIEVPAGDLYDDVVERRFKIGRC